MSRLREKPFLSHACMLRFYGNGGVVPEMMTFTSSFIRSLSAIYDFEAAAHSSVM